MAETFNEQCTQFRPSLARGGAMMTPCTLLPKMSRSKLSKFDLMLKSCKGFLDTMSMLMTTMLAEPMCLSFENKPETSPALRRPQQSERMTWTSTLISAQTSVDQTALLRSASSSGGSLHESMTVSRSATALLPSTSVGFIIFFLALGFGFGFGCANIN